MGLTRRRLLSTAAGVAATGSLAGCIGGSTDPPRSTGGTTAQASFYVFGDLLSTVAGDAATTDLLVPVGQHGHGWEPGPRVREAIRRADLLVHGMPDFQPWVDDIRTDLDADGAAVTTVDASADVDLLEAGASHRAHAGEDHSGEAHDEHTEGEHTEHTAETHTDEEHDEHTEGEHTEHTAETHTDEEHDEHTEGDHDHGSVDPHFWMDPLRLRTAVGTVERSLADADPDGAEAYAGNATALRERLTGLHEQVAVMVEGADTDVLLVAGHDSFQYLGARYGIEVAALTGLSPDDRPTPRDIKQAQEVVREHDLRYVCADPLESGRAAEQLVAETDAEAVLPLTAMPGRTEAWATDDWGYVEVMEAVNLPTLADALGAR